MTTPAIGNAASYTTTNTVGYWQSAIAQKWGAKAGAAYVSYNGAHPAEDPQANANDFIEIVLVSGLDQAIAAGTAGTATELGAIPGAAAKGAASAVHTLTTPSSWIAALFQGAIWLRVAEAVAGLILLGIGLNAMLKGKPLSAVTSAAGAAGKAAMF
jgi:hypothetical protein